MHNKEQRMDNASLYIGYRENINIFGYNGGPGRGGGGLQ